MSATKQELVGSATFSASGNSPAFTLASMLTAVVGVDITAVTGTGSPTMDAWLQVSDDGGTTWYDMPADWALKTNNAAAQGTLTPASGSGVRDIVDGATAAGDWLGIYKHLAADRVRLKWIISGTFTAGQGFTFSASIVGK